MDDLYEMMDELRRLVAPLKQETFIQAHGMTREQFLEEMNEIVRLANIATQDVRKSMQRLGEAFADELRSAIDGFTEVVREVENDMRESWVIVLDHFMPEKWARSIVLRIPSQIIWRLDEYISYIS